MFAILYKNRIGNASKQPYILTQSSVKAEIIPSNCDIARTSCNDPTGYSTNDDSSSIDTFGTLTPSNGPTGYSTIGDSIF